MNSAGKSLRGLCERGALRLDWSEGLEEAPKPPGQPPDWGRAEGMILGLAIGDALGNTSEGMLPSARRAAHDTKDNDTVAAIVGAAVGALHGAAAVPARWKDNLLGRTGADDDGRFFELLAQAKGLFGE